MSGETINSEATALMERGIDLLQAQDPEGILQAVAFFEQAIALRRPLHAPGDHGTAYLLAGSWLSRGDALVRLGGPERLADALISYDEALAVLRDAPPELELLYRRRHAIAWMHRGLTLQEQRTEDALPEAVRSYEQAVAVVGDAPEHSLLAGSIFLNQARALLAGRPVRAVEARRSAFLALDRVREIETQAPLAAEIHLKAQILLCRAAETLLADGSDPTDAPELVAAATDAIETGLALARRWEERGETSLRPLSTVLFRFGMDIYGRRQPQFLNEFIRENLRDSLSVEWHRLAAEVLAAVARRSQHDGFTFLTRPGANLVTETIQLLRLTEERLRELSRRQNEAAV